MHKSILVSIGVAPLAWACASVPPPTQRMADAQAAARSAEELGANNVPAAELSLKLAEEQISLAEKAIAEEENERANSLLLRAKADAELAIAQAREKVARVDVREAAEDAAAQKDLNESQGVPK